MYTGTLINDLYATVERVRNSSRSGSESAGPQNFGVESSRAASNYSVRDYEKGCSEPEQLSQPFGLSAADRDLGLLLVVHAELIRALEPRNDLANAVNVDEV
jgi:hypothetical protein